MQIAFFLQAVERAADQQHVVIAVYRNRAHVAHVEANTVRLRRIWSYGLIPPQLISGISVKLDRRYISEAARVSGIPVSIRETTKYSLRDTTLGGQSQRNSQK